MMNKAHYTLLNFKKTLEEKYGISHNDFKDNYVYCGSNKERKKAQKCGITPQMICDLTTDKCLCGVSIEENVYFRHKTTHNIIVIGNVCKYRYIEKSKKLNCLICFKPHQNRKDNYCKECRKSIKKTQKIINDKDKKNFQELNNYDYIPWEAIRPNNDYCYSVNKYQQEGRKIVKFKCLYIDNDKITCKYDMGYIRDLPRHHKYNTYVFYKENKLNI